MVERCIEFPILLLQLPHMLKVRLSAPDDPAPRDPPQRSAHGRDEQENVENCAHYLIFAVCIRNDAPAGT